MGKLYVKLEWSVDTAAASFGTQQPVHQALRPGTALAVQRH
jgi:hypothetical protein